MVIPCRFSFVNVFEPKADLSGNLKYSAQLILEKKGNPLYDDVNTVLGVIRKSMDEAIEKAIARGKLSSAQAKSSKFRIPLRDGDDPANESMPLKGCWFINASNKMQPGIVGPTLEPIMDRNQFYSGCYGYAAVSFYAFNQQGNIGVGVSLDNVMKKLDGERLDGRQSAETVFAGLAE